MPRFHGMPITRAWREVAQRFYRAVFAAAEELSTSPEIGSPRWQWVASILAGLRCRKVDSTFYKWLIFYRPASYGIEVVRILHGARDIESELSTEG